MGLPGGWLLLSINLLLVDNHLKKRSVSMTVPFFYLLVLFVLFWSVLFCSDLFLASNGQPIEFRAFIAGITVQTWTDLHCNYARSGV